MKTAIQPEKIFHKGFILACCFNFLFFMAFYMLIPVLPQYLLEDLHAGKGVTGVLLSIYVLSALAVRPWSGYIVDTYPRKKVFLLCALAYALVFWGYLWITPLLLFGLWRFVHGFVFGMANTASVTVATDMIPPERMGTGVGFFGLTNAVPMAVGPMLGTVIYNSSGAVAVFYTAVALSGASTVLSFFIPVSNKADLEKAPAHTNLFKKIYLPNAAKLGICLAGVGFAYGIVLNYITVFAKEVEITVNVGLFFLLLAIGMVFSRLIAGRFIDKGHISFVIIGGTVLCCISLTILTFFPQSATFLATALLYGLGVGLVMPAYQTVFIKMAGPEQRGLANSSFFIAWDGGIGIALFTGGFIAQLSSFTALYVVGAVLLALSAGMAKCAR